MNTEQPLGLDELLGAMPSKKRKKCKEAAAALQDPQAALPGVASAAARAALKDYTKDDLSMTLYQVRTCLLGDILVC